MKVCADHGAQPRIYNYCGKCGALLVVTDDPSCFCGQIILGDDKFCTGCGVRLR